MLLASYALVLARACAAPEPDGKSMLVGLVESVGGAVAVLPLPITVDETQSFRALSDAVGATVQASRAHSTPLFRLRIALGVEAGVLRGEVPTLSRHAGGAV